MALKVPMFREAGLTGFLTALVEKMEADKDDKLDRLTANHSVILQSPGNKVYEVTVNDAGALVITLVAG